jgi:hypothetical protein
MVTSGAGDGGLADAAQACVSALRRQIADLEAELAPGGACEMQLAEARHHIDELGLERTLAERELAELRRTLERIQRGSLARDAGSQEITRDKGKTMSKPINPLTGFETHDGLVADVPVVDDLVKALASDDHDVRKDARTTLVALAQRAVPGLLAALMDVSGDTRWEAARALREIGDPSTAPALVHALEDQNFDIRWIAAEGLIAQGQDALNPLLQALLRRPPSRWLLEGAHHVLNALDRQGSPQEAVRPVLAALEEVDPALTVPPAAESALLALGGLSTSDSPSDSSTGPLASGCAAKPKEGNK